MKITFILALFSAFTAAAQNPYTLPKTASAVNPLPAPVVTAPVGGGNFQNILRPSVMALLDASQKRTNLNSQRTETSRLRPLFSALPPSAERDSALRLCGIIEQAVDITAQAAKKLDSPAMKTIAEGAEARESFFKKRIETDWKKAILPLQNAARAEWQKIPASAGHPALASIEAVKEVEAKTVRLFIRVNQATKSGALANPMESYAIAGAQSRVGGGGNVGTGYRPSAKTIWIKAISGVTDGQQLHIEAIRDGVYNYTTVLGAESTVEQWRYLRTVAPEE
jgi:hypothetical protein